MSYYKRFTKWKNIPSLSRKNSHRKKNRSPGRSRRRQAAKNVFKTPLIQRCNPLSSTKKLIPTPCTSRSSQVSYPTLPKEGTPLQNDSTSVTQRSSAPGKLLQYSVPVIIDLTNDDDDDNVFSCPSTPTPSSRRPHSNSRTSESCQYIKYRDTIGENDIDGQIYDMLINGPRQSGSSPPQTLGHVYCASREGSPGHIKIGWTEKSPSERMKQISPKGRFGKLTCTESGLFAHSRLAERVIHRELWNQRRKSNFQDMLGGYTYERSERETISGSSKQATESGKTEWFQIERDHAEEVRDKWVTWFRKCDPYDQSGELDKFWKSWFTRQMKRNPYCKATHSSLHLRWNALLNPTRLQIYWYHLEPVADQCYAWVKDNPRVTFGIIMSCVFLVLFYLYFTRTVVGLITCMVTIILLSRDNTYTKMKQR